jgi:uncharacterized membrane protein
MEKTKLGISVGLLGAIFLFAGFFSGYIVAFLIAGYILIAEENAWLKRTAVKGLVLMLVFTIVNALINLIPGALDLLQEAARIFDNTIDLPPVIDRIFYFLTSILSYIERILFLILGFKALKQETLVIPPLDKFVSRFVD